jgi:hypothetical protein
MLTVMPNQIAGAVAWWTSRVVEMTQVVLSRRAGSAQLWGRYTSLLL